LSHTTICGTPPKKAKARLWAARKAGVSSESAASA
jgi:hypothetical protein